MMSLAVPVSHLCTPYVANAAYDGLDTYIGWRMAAFRKKGRPQLRYKDVCKRDECPKMDHTNGESLADNRGALKQELSSSVKNGELALKETSDHVLKRFLVLT